MPSRNLKVVAPLNSFRWSGDDWVLFPGIKIVRERGLPDLKGLEQTLGEDEHRSLDSVTHWLEFDWIQETDTLSAAEVVNLSVLSLWLAQPTKATVSIRFEFESGGTSKGRTRLLDRFQWVEGAANEQTQDSDLGLASQLFSPLLDLCGARGRINNSVALTMAGCWSDRWQPVLICHSAALESLLTYSREAGITRRLAKAYACLIGHDSPSRDAAFREFSEIYGARSDVMHGRMHEIATVNRLPFVARTQAVLRTLFRHILLTPTLARVLEATDSAREAHFTSLCAGYSPPKAPRR